MKQTTIRDARNTLTSLIHEVERGKPVRLTRHGKPVAVLMSDTQFQNMQNTPVPKRSFSSWIKDWAATLPDDWKAFTAEDVNSWRDRSLDGGRPPLKWES